MDRVLDCVLLIVFAIALFFLIDKPPVDAVEPKTPLCELRGGQLSFAGYTQVSEMDKENMVIVKVPVFICVDDGTPVVKEPKRVGRQPVSSPEQF